MNRDDCLREALVFLDSARPWYPGGIPRSATESAQPVAEKQTALLHFIGVLPAAGRSILDAAITQGLKLDPLQVRSSALTEKDIAASSKLQQIVDAKIKEHAAHVVVFMGSNIADVVFNSAQREALDEDGFLSYQGQRVLLADNLADIAGDAQAKKRFWNELKKARTLFIKEALT